MPLTVKIIQEAKPGINPQGNLTNKPYKLGDSGGLFLLVTPAGGKWWRFKYRYGGKEKQISLGTYPLVSLNKARIQRDAFRALLANGLDPSDHRKKENMAKVAQEARRVAATRFTLEPDGGLSIRLGNRRIALTPVETMELQSFLQANPPENLMESLCP